jgi:hypothetical protein
VTVPGCAAPASVEIRCAVERRRGGGLRLRCRGAPAHHVIEADAAQELVTDWWSAPRRSAPSTPRRSGWPRCRREIVGVGELGHIGDDPVIYKLYIGSHRRGEVSARSDRPDDRDARTAPPRVLIEHVAANVRGILRAQGSSSTMST